MKWRNPNDLNLYMQLKILSEFFPNVLVTPSSSWDIVLKQIFSRNSYVPVYVGLLTCTETMTSDESISARQSIFGSAMMSHDD